MKHVLLVLLAAVLVLVLPGRSASAAPKPVRTVAIQVTSNGFEPASVHLRAGAPVRLVVTRTVERTCATDIVFESLGIRKALPLNKPVVVAFTPKRAGTIRYACAMNMIAGSLMVE